MALAMRRPQIIEPSRLKNGYRGILDQAKAEGMVLIRERDDDHLCIVREELYSALESSYAESQDFAQFVVATRRALSDCDPRYPDAVTLGRLSWAADLGHEDFLVFAQEYIDSFFRAMNDGNWDRHRQLLIEWRDTAVVERDPELRARVRGMGEAAHVDLERPGSAS